MEVEGSKIETTFRATGKFKETVLPRPQRIGVFLVRGGGALYGKAKGIVVTNDDSREIATLTVQGAGRITGQGGKVSFHVSKFFFVQLQQES